MIFAKAAVQLLDELVRAHERSPANAVTVVPVLTDDLEALAPLLHALVGSLPGVYIDASPKDLTNDFPITSDPVRRAAVNRAIGDLPGRPVKFVAAGGGLGAVDYDPPDTSPPSPGEAALLAVLRAALHSDLDSTDFGLIVYRDGSIDYPSRRPLWNLFAQDLQAMTHAALRTLVVVVESAISIDLHCRVDSGFRFAIDSGRLLRRTGRDNVDVWCNDMASHAGPVVLFLGAGFSWSSNLPLGNTLRDVAIRSVLGLDPSDARGSDELALAFHAWISSRTGWLTPREDGLPADEYARTLTLEQVVRAERKQSASSDSSTLEEFRIRHDRVVGSPGPAVRHLLDMLSAGGRNKLVLAGVNFDELLELNSSVEIQVFSSEADFAAAADYVRRYLDGFEDRVPYLKFHGTISQPSTCVVSAEQTENGVGAGKLESVRAVLGRGPTPYWVFVGASMRDRDLTNFFGTEEFAKGTHEVWVMPYLVDTVEEFARQHEGFWARTDWPKVDDHFISQTADVFIGALAQVWATV